MSTVTIHALFERRHSQLSIDVLIVKNRFRDEATMVRRIRPCLSTRNLSFKVGLPHIALTHAN